MISSHSLDSSRLRRGDVCTGGLPVTPLVSAAHDGAGRSEIRPQRPHEGDVIDIDNPRRLQKADVIGRDGTKLGTVSAVYYDNNTDHPAWVAVRTGLFGTHVRWFRWWPRSCRARSCTFPSTSSSSRPRHTTTPDWS